jgi:hypothetical protein
VSLSGASQVRWRHDGRELFYAAPDNRLMAVPVRAGSKEGQIDFGAPVPLFSLGLGGVNYIVSPDGQRFLLNQHVAAPVPIAIILNWKAKP